MIRGMAPRPDSLREVNKDLVQRLRDNYYVLRSTAAHLQVLLDKPRDPEEKEFIANIAADIENLLRED